MNRYRESGAAGLTDARRGKPGTHRIDEALRHHILTLLGEMHRTVSESSPELDDIFVWQTLRTLSKSLTLQYDKILYLVEPTEENSCTAGEKILAFDYPDGTLAYRHGSRILEYQMFDKLECISHGRIVDNKRLGAVLKLAQ